MKRKLQVLITACLFLSSCGVFLQKTGLKNYKLKSKIEQENLNDYQYDFLYLCKLLDIGFPDLNNIFPENKRDSLKTVILQDLSHKDISNEYFFIQTSKYLSNVHNEHTIAYFNKLSFENDYPFRLFFSLNNWYLSDVSKQQDSSLIGKKVLRINDIDIKKIEKKFLRFTCAENLINRQKFIQRLQMFNIPEYLKEIGVIKEFSDTLKLSFDDRESIEITTSKANEQDLYDIKTPSHDITKYQNKTYFYKLYPDNDFGYLQFNKCHDEIDILEGIKSYVKPWLQPLAGAYVKRQFKKEKPSKLIAPYYNPEYPIFKDFIREMTDSLNNNHIKNLIIDLRNNPGGNLTLGVQLIYFLTKRTDLKGFTEYAYTSDFYKKYFFANYTELKKKHPNGVPDNELVLINDNNNLFNEITNKNSKYYIPENRPVYNGNVYILSNYNSGSAAALLTTLFQDNEIGTIIGTSVGNNPTGATTWTPFKLPKTKASVTIATSYIERPNKLNGKLQIPDFWIEYSINELLTGKDPYFEKAKELIDNNAGR